MSVWCARLKAQCLGYVRGENQQMSLSSCGGLGGHQGSVACQGLWPPVMPWQAGRYLMPLWRKVCLTFWDQYTGDVSLVKEGATCACLLSHVQLFVTPWTVAHQAPLPVEFSRQEYWSELPFPPPGDLPDPGLEPESPAFPALASQFLTTGAAQEAPRKGRR